MFLITLRVLILYNPQLTEPPGSLSHPQTLTHNPLVLSQRLNLPPVSDTILLSSLYNLNTAGAARHRVGKIDRCILFEIPVTLAFLNFAFQPISRLIHHAHRVSVLNLLKDTVGLHYITSCLPKCFAPFFAVMLVCSGGGCVQVWVVAGCWMFRRALNWLSLPRVERPRSSEVTDMQITPRRAYIFSRQGCVSALGQQHYGNARWIFLRVWVG